MSRDDYLVPKRWPWSGDTKLGQIQRIALSYRSLCESLIFGVVVDPQAALEAEDQEWLRYGHLWVRPSGGHQPELNQWMTPRDVAHYVSQWYPCTERDVYSWIKRNSVTHRTTGKRNVEVLWESVLNMDSSRSRRRAKIGKHLA